MSDYTELISLDSLEGIIQDDPEEIILDNIEDSQNDIPEKVSLEETNAVLSDEAPQESNICSVCYAEVVNCVFHPCGHLICKTCVSKMVEHNIIDKCHLCRQNIENITLDDGVSIPINDVSLSNVNKNMRISYSNIMNPIISFIGDNITYGKHQIYESFIFLCTTALYISLWISFGFLILIEKKENISGRSWLIEMVTIIFLLYDVTKIAMGFISTSLPEFTMTIPTREDRLFRRRINEIFLVIPGTIYLSFSIVCIFLIITHELSNSNFTNGWMMIMLIVIIILNILKESLIFYFHYCWDEEYNSDEMINDEN